MSETIKKINFIKVTEERELDEGALMFRFEHDEELFFMMLKPLSDEYIVINVSNPIALPDYKFNTPIFDLINKFNIYAVGTKCIVSNEEKNQFIFTREEVITISDVSNNDIVELRVNIALDLVKSAVDILPAVDKEKD